MGNHRSGEATEATEAVEVAKALPVLPHGRCRAAYGTEQVWVTIGRRSRRSGEATEGTEYHRGDFYAAQREKSFF